MTNAVYVEHSRLIAYKVPWPIKRFRRRQERARNLNYCRLLKRVCMFCTHRDSVFSPSSQCRREMTIKHTWHAICFKEVHFILHTYPFYFLMTRKVFLKKEKKRKEKRMCPLCMCWHLNSIWSTMCLRSCNIVWVIESFNSGQLT